MLQVANERGVAVRKKGDGLATGLAWFGVGLGLVELGAPRVLSRTIGVRDGAICRATMRALGLREVLNGAALLGARRSQPWLWARVAGDAIDLGMLALATRSRRRRAGWAGLATAATALLGVTALDLAAALRSRRRADPRAGDQEVTRAITIARPPAEVYACWRDLSELAQVFSHVESITRLDARRSHWRVKAPAGTTVAFDAEIVDDRPGELIAWRSLPDADIDSTGTVRFERAPGDRGTQLHVHMRYAAPAGRLGVAIAKLFGEAPEQQIAADLRHLKQVLETGSIVHSDASIHAGMHPARPRDQQERMEVIP